MDRLMQFIGHLNLTIITFCWLNWERCNIAKWFVIIVLYMGAIHWTLMFLFSYKLQKRHLLMVKRYIEVDLCNIIMVVLFYFYNQYFYLYLLAYGCLMMRIVENKVVNRINSIETN